MKLISTDKYRSVACVNEDYDMIRVKIDMPIHEWRKIRKKLGLPYLIPKTPVKGVGNKIKQVVDSGGKGIINF